MLNVYDKTQHIILLHINYGVLVVTSEVLFLKFEKAEFLFSKYSLI